MYGTQYLSSSYKKQIVCLNGHCKEITQVVYQPPDQTPQINRFERDFTVNQNKHRIEYAPMYEEERKMLLNNKGRTKW